ncbi:pyruvate dehydrogenase E2 component (dihydrolipoamide acetyltransferase) [Fluviicoccus keumensis]|uniref:Dihydrolipoamide acetyltransferase component of pyruvate dehydrogenase complex n=1 Tax=Fluviicoccus keumensis TaxID=1435465 RepID=A0A4Q7YHQ9_9GAMM|nr:dihydrolipoamide acetyltransferase family protein [Fluviicoccus keumensis]RZU36947.1 pyruvate dehydrogenase E2 component (dihydrolipoamide acetyltransferase) [Fluviicoccus keumensis]
MNLFRLPDLGEGLKEAVVTEWLATTGQHVRQGETILAVETAKSIVEIPAPENLRLTELLAAVGNHIQVGQPLFSWLPASDTPVSAAPVDQGSVVGHMRQSTIDTEDRPFRTGATHFTAAARTEARQRCHPSRQSAVADTTAATESGKAGPRLWMHRQLAAAHRDVVQVTVFDAVYLRQPLHPVLPQLVKALCRACREVPEANAWLRGEDFQPQQDIHMTLAVDTDYGLMTPVLRHADRLRLRDITSGLHVLVDKARSHRLQPEDHQGGTITLSSFGSLGGRFATPLVVPPQVAILGVGRMQQTVQPGKSGRLQTRYVLPLSLSVDHRALTGGEAVRFLNAVIAALIRADRKKNRP